MKLFSGKPQKETPGHHFDQKENITYIKAFALPWLAQQRLVAAVIILNFTAMNRIKVNIEMSSIRMSKIETNIIGMNQINGHSVNLQVGSISSVKALSDVTRFVINDRLKIEVLTQKAVSDNVFRLFFVICEPQINYESKIMSHPMRRVIPDLQVHLHRQINSNP